MRCLFCSNMANLAFSKILPHCKSCYDAHEKAGECPNE